MMTTSQKKSLLKYMVELGKEVKKDPKKRRKILLQMGLIDKDGNVLAPYKGHITLKEPL